MLNDSTETQTRIVCLKSTNHTAKLAVTNFTIEQFYTDLITFYRPWHYKCTMLCMELLTALLRYVKDNLYSEEITVNSYEPLRVLGA